MWKECSEPATLAGGNPSSGNRKVDRNPGREVVEGDGGEGGGGCTCLLGFLVAVFISNDSEKPTCDSEREEEGGSRRNMETSVGTSSRNQE